MDSSAALHYAIKVLNLDVVGAIAFDYGSKHNDEEFLRAEMQAHSVKVPIKRVDLKEISKHLVSDLLKTGGDIPEGHYADPSMKRTVVPFRNGIMLAIAAGIAESEDAGAIVLGNHFGDHAIYPDCRADFSCAMSDAIRLGTYKQIELLTPFVSKSKTDIATIGASLGVDFGLTYSCYKGGKIHCGKCGTCFERKEAFRESGIEDPTEYLA